MKEIQLTKNQFALVDDQDFEWLSKNKWFIQKSSKYRSSYATTNIHKASSQKSSSMHRQIVEKDLGRKLSKDEEIDHIDQNGLNNQKMNLRIATKQQQKHNQPKQRGEYTSKYKGVTWNTTRKRWKATIGPKNNRRNLGDFNDEIDAAKAYDYEAKKEYKEFAFLNFPEFNYNVFESKPNRKNLSSRFVGVSFYKRIKKWHAFVMINGKKVHIGTYDNEKDAALARESYIINNNLKNRLNFQRPTLLKAGEQYDEDYFQRGIQTGKSLYENYRWISELTLPMAMSMIDYLNINRQDTVLDFGTCYGMLVKALRLLHRQAYGVDISKHAIENADPQAKPYVKIMNDDGTIPNFNDITKFDFVIAKDCLEHVDYSDIDFVLREISEKCNKIFIVVPLGEHKKYIIRQYEKDYSHRIRENMSWWTNMLSKHFEILDAQYKIDGLKENWTSKYDKGNAFILGKS